MRALITPRFVVSAVLLGVTTLTTGCSRETSRQHTAGAAPARSEALILQESDGEHRVHLPRPARCPISQRYSL
jgi:hypothetical protein